MISLITPAKAETAMHLRCTICKTVNDLDADYCKHCGAKLE